MTGFFKKGDALERELRDARPVASDELVSKIEGRLRSGRPAHRRTSFRLALPVALTVAVVSALAAVGGVSYAASSVASAAKSVAHVFVPAKQAAPVVVSGLTSGGDQYRPGYGKGDKNHNHTGPPGLKKKGGQFSPPLTAKARGLTATVSTSFTIDEQGDLTISVINSKTGKQLLITQSKSKVGQGVKGPATKNLRYEVLIPRTIPIKLAIPARLLLPGHAYAIRIKAKDFDGNKSQLLIPFKG